MEQLSERQEDRRDVVAGLEIFRKTWKDGRPWVVIYNANRRPGNRFPKALLNLLFPTWERAEARIAAEVEARLKWEERKKARAKERQEYRHDFKLGDILYTSWGYDQTNVEFFQVVAVPSDKSITIREISAHNTDRASGPMSCYVMPNPGAFLDKPAVTKRVSPSGSVRFESYRYGWKWDGRERYCSWYA